jgi:membrane associated rhomboid family serine protease
LIVDPEGRGEIVKSISVPPPGFLPYVTIAIIILCTLVFAMQAVLGEAARWDMLLGFSMIPAVVTGERILPPAIPTLGAGFSLISAMFLHADFWHLAGNMMLLWLVGDGVEGVMGHLRFVILYLLCGLAGAVAQILPDPGSLDPVVGASGAISGVLAAAIMLHPTARLRLPLGHRRIVLPVSLYAAVGGWFGIQLVEALSGDPEGAVAWLSHLGGFAAGMILVFPLARRAEATPPASLS